MFQKTFPTKTTLSINTSIIGERLEERVQRMLYNQEPIGDGAPLIYTDRRKGVEPQYDIRTDRFEIALQSIDTVSKQAYAKREEFYKNLENQNEPSGKKEPNGSTDTTT